MIHTPDILVLGAGPAGLGLAYRAAGAGHKVVVVEREQHVGGVSASFTVAGVRVDHGSHRLHRTIAPEILAELRHLLGNDLQRRHRHGRIRLADRWLPFPLTPLATARNLPPGFGVRAALEAATSWTRRPHADTFAQVVRGGLGPTMAERFYEPYARKLWGLDPEQISGEQARRRIGATGPATILRRVLAGRDPDARTFLYPRRGFGQLWESLAEAAAGRGVAFALGRTATAIDLRGGEVTGGRVTAHLDDGRRLEGRHLFSTVPLPVLVRLLRPAPPDDVLTAAARLRTRAMVLAYLVLDTPRYTPYDAHYLPETWTPVTRISEPKNYRDGHAGPHDDGDPSDHTVLCAEIPCSRDDAMWRAPDHTICEIVADTLRCAGLPGATVTQVATRRLPSAYPIYDLGFEERLTRVDAWIQTLPNISTYGRQGLFVHDNSHHALAMAWAAADALGPDGTIDSTSWTAARGRFAQHVVED
jgi:protoporphyrinogen oxidase